MPVIFHFFDVIIWTCNIKWQTHRESYVFGQLMIIFGLIRSFVCLIWWCWWWWCCLFILFLNDHSVDCMMSRSNKSFFCQTYLRSVICHWEKLAIWWSRHESIHFFIHYENHFFHYHHLTKTERERVREKNCSSTFWVIIALRAKGTVVRTNCNLFA